MLRAGKAAEAAKLAGDFLRDDAQFVPLLGVRARALAVAGTLEQAVKHAQRALQLDPDDRALLGLFKALRGIERAKADGNAAFAARRTPAALDAYTTALAKCDDAAERLDGAPRLAELRAPLHANRAAAHIQARQYEPALADCT